MSPVPSPADLSRVQLQFPPEEVGVDPEELAESIHCECSEWRRWGGIWRRHQFLLSRENRMSLECGGLQIRCDLVQNGKGVLQRGSGQRCIFFRHSPHYFYLDMWM